MEGIQVDFTDFSSDPASNTHQHHSVPVNNNAGAQKYNVTGNEGQTSWLHSVGAKRAILVASMVVSVIVIVLVVVLPVVLIQPPTSATESTLQTTLPTSQQFLTKCQPATGTKSAKKVEAPTVKTQHKKVKITMATGNNGNRVPIKNTYIVEFTSDSGVTNHFETVTKSLKASHNIQTSEIQKRYHIVSSLFHGVSFTVHVDHPVEAIEMIPDAIAVYPVYTVHVSSPILRSVSSDTLDSDGMGADSIHSYNLTGVAQVREKFNNFGKGVKVAVIDTGVYYKHPALGGCFGLGCKVEFGYDYLGDDYGITSETPVPDDDPLDNCSDSSHGTHVAGIIAANTTGINETEYLPSIPFFGVAPQVTLGAYRVLGCSGEGPTDAITQAIYSAYEAGADIINLSLGSATPYPESSDSIAVQRVIDEGVYVVVAAGNSGSGGLETVGSPSLSSRTMAIASVDNTYTLKYFIVIAPDGNKILYEAVAGSGGWQTIVNSTIVVNNPNSTINDGCFNLLKPMSGAVALFYVSSDDWCSEVSRCNQAAAAGAIGCLLYNSDTVTGSSTIPCGSISLQDGLNIIATVTANASAIYTFTDLLALTSVETAGTPSWFTSFGLSGDLLLKPQISGIGGEVYSTISPFAAEQKQLTKMYGMLSGTSMACPYVAGTLALFLASIDNPAPTTTSGYADNGICRPDFSVAMNLFQSTATLVNIYSTSLFATAAQQGAGLVNIYRVLTATTMISPSELSLNDTVRTNASYTINVFNIGNQAARYAVTHGGAALATGKTLDDDQLLNTPLFSDDYATVIINPTEFELQSGESGEITLQFTAPANVNPNLLPIYSGFIYVRNQINGEIVHMSYAGVVGDYANTSIIVQNSASGYITGILDPYSNYISYEHVSTLNATEGLTIRVAIAWPTRLLIGEVVATENGSLSGSNSSYGIVRDSETGFPLVRTDVPRNVASTTVQSFSPYYSYDWAGDVYVPVSNGNSTDLQTNHLSSGEYRIRFSALKHFGNDSNPDDFEIYHTPPFYLVY